MRKIWKILLTGCCCALLSQSMIVSAWADSAYDNVAISRVTGYVNVRQEPNTQSSIIGKIYNNCAATIQSSVEGEGGTWYQIQSGSVNGYIKAQYFITGAEAEAIAKEIGTTYATVNADSLRLREKPDLTSNVLTLLSKDATYQVIGEEGNFAKIAIDTDLEGYISKDYIKTTVELDKAVSLAEEAAKAAETQQLKDEAVTAIAQMEEAKKSAENNKTIEANPEGDGVSSTVSAPPASSVAGPGEQGPAGSGSVSDQVVSATRNAVVAYAKQFIGNPYLYGGTSLTEGADCSGFTMSVFAHFGISTGRSSRDQAVKGREISVESVQPGDLLFYGSSEYINHVALYIGGGKVVHSSTPKTGITITSANYRTPCKAVSFLD